ncbi:baculoviral IAP repeat-containing protein 7-A-like isoform X2 [Ruditapes philippinarum]|nr:baculoviral IAP repeat-containing protein 7-A-like isoform X2 [Ruditapes philippinarum]XP_060586308.1 baculoviral IAP repeat-containing protein 7-A-like isoform X2 [Ruditapes philippinarum]XP_060586309.1 baculoviral IAP repeat-containing protein 7-A-like isoform X2 [Ruditapes philippinarum]
MNSETSFVRDGFLNPPERDPARLPSPHYGVTEATVRLTHQARHPLYAVYGERLRSFARWTRTNPDPVCLCNAGFFFTNEGDLVRCFFCGIGLKDFTDSDDPLREHVRHSEKCLYLFDHLGTVRLASIKASCQDQDRLKDNSATRCRHPEYQSYESRLSSFTDWPTHLSQKPEDLADAGLYHIGSESEQLYESVITVFDKCFREVLSSLHQGFSI